MVRIVKDRISNKCCWQGNMSDELGWRAARRIDGGSHLANGHIQIAWLVMTNGIKTTNGESRSNTEFVPRWGISGLR